MSHKLPTIPEVMEELKKISSIGLPIIFMTLLNYLKNMVLVISMGKLGNLELAGGALAIGFTNLTGYSILSGLSMGMDPLCNQAIGSQNHSLATRTLQRTILMLLLFSLPISISWINFDRLMINQDRDVTRIGSIYCLYSVPDLITNCVLFPLRIYLRSRGRTWVLMWCALFSFALSIPLSLFSLRFGVAGIATANFVANVVAVVFLVCYTRVNAYDHVPVEEPLLSCSRVVIEDWGVLFRLAVTSCVGVCLEWWWYEFMTILSGFLDHPRVALASSAIVIQTTSLMYIIPHALSSSASTRLGNELGAGRPMQARLATIVVIGLALLTSLIGLTWTILCRNSWGKLFTNDQEILNLTTIVLPIIGLCELANCPQTTICGVLRGSARVGVGATINFCSFYLVGAPMAIVLGFVWKLGFVGVCYGLLGAQIVCVVSMLIVVCTTNWEREVLKDLLANAMVIIR